MPRGIPNVKRDDTSGMRFTTFHVPLPPNPKHITSSYLKAEGQTLWSRNARTKPPEELPSRRGSNVLVIHPGSRWLRVGLASDTAPAWVPAVIARKHSLPIPVSNPMQRISRIRDDAARRLDAEEDVDMTEDEYAVAVKSDDPVEEKIAAIQMLLRDRMRFYKMRVTPNATTIARRFNEQFEPTYIREQTDPWIREPRGESAIVGDKVLRMADPTAMGYAVRWPIYGRTLNTRDGVSRQLLLDDIEVILRTALAEQLEIVPSAYQEYSVVLVIPDFYDKLYVRSLCDILLMKMGFKRLCAQQESLAATYGAGMSTACVIDMGATSTSIACVDEGMVVADTRMTLSMGGDDITEFLYVLFKRIDFPYRTMDLTRAYDWAVLEDLKTRLCTLAEGDVALNLYEFLVRSPTGATAKYGLRAYDEIILAPMCLFDTRLIEFDKKRAGLAFSSADVTEEIVEHLADEVTMAMSISTSHLQTALATPPVVPPQDATHPEGTNGHIPPPGAESTLAEAAPPLGPSPLQSLGIPADPSIPSHFNADDPLSAPAWQPTPGSEALPLPDFASIIRPPPATPLVAPPIDIFYEASKLPLDVAIFNSARGAGGDDKIKKYLQAVLVVGGSACLPGMSQALESRLQAIASPLVPNMEKVQIIPCPKDVDPHNLVWKGASVLAKLDGVADLWVTDEEWNVFGMRGLRERCFYL